MKRGGWEGGGVEVAHTTFPVSGEDQTYNGNVPGSHSPR